MQYIYYKINVSEIGVNALQYDWGVWYTPYWGQPEKYNKHKFTNVHY